ncbi:hypothetical protein SNE35_14185 [Paucibacter sp. R3-3]|uniref:Flagellar hook-associated protein 2 C-terminal domain-containing protein n=1 Tax=Roseateles agri TaxID=3098619 RepID=A0ABU5DIR5_9BURK|nr:hypothetical protein [Paucibacter sp. R3-3]MDY0745666.1 hypothetical protein [Paucibacter sp. R3-3]
MLSTIGKPLIGYMAQQTADSTSTDGSTPAGKTTGRKGIAETAMQTAIQQAAGGVKTSKATHALDDSQKTLATDLRAAMSKAGAKLSGAVDFSVDSDGTLETKGSDSDKAAVKSFLNADTSTPSFATRIATQAQDAQKLSSTIQQSAAISQAAKYAKSSSGVLSLYASMMDRSAASNVVFSVSPDSSSLSYPGSLSTDA